jgi:hypothetical protein
MHIAFTICFVKNHKFYTCSTNLVSIMNDDDILNDNHPFGSY